MGAAATSVYLLPSRTAHTIQLSVSASPLFILNPLSDVPPLPGVWLCQASLPSTSSPEVAAGALDHSLTAPTQGIKLLGWSGGSPVIPVTLTGL